jgi:hypothetical protein
MMRLLAPMMRLLAPMMRLLTSMTELLTPILRLLTPMTELLGSTVRLLAPNRGYRAAKTRSIGASTLFLRRRVGGSSTSELKIGIATVSLSPYHHSNRSINS